MSPGKTCAQKSSAIKSSYAAIIYNMQTTWIPLHQKHVCKGHKPTLTTQSVPTSLMCGRTVSSRSNPGKHVSISRAIQILT